MDALTILTTNKEIALVALLILLSIFFYLWKRQAGTRHSSHKTTAHHYTEQLPATNIKSFVGREDVLALLQDTWQEGGCHILALSAWGGTGKSSIINKWLDNPLEGQKPENVYSWSFHNQGDTGKKQSSSSEFIEHALKFFNNSQTNFTSEHEKSTHLAKLIAAQRNVLILDGLEPFQYSANDSDDMMRGKLRDTGLKALLQQLALENQGLCLITSREDLDHEFCQLGTVVNFSLENLSESDSIQLLRTKNIQGSDEELVQAAQDYNHHAFSLTLLGNYLSDQSIQDRSQLPSLSGYQTQAEAIFGLMAAYEQHLENHHPMALALLYVMGLFDHDVNTEILNELLNKVDDNNRVSESLKKLRSTRRFRKAVQLLQDVDLLNVDEKNKLGCHPLTREYFGKKFQKDYSNSWLKSHHVLYDYYKQLPEKELPDTEEEMEPLFAAITHGCAARLHEQVLNEVYWPRIKRGDEHYSTKKLGAFSSDLAALSHFFDRTWHTPAKELSKKHRAGILNWAATRLRALGRLREALEPMQAGMTIYMEESNWKYAASVASSLSGLQLIQGDIKDAINTAEQGIELAYAGDDDYYWQMATRTTLADALHQLGEAEKASILFNEAEELQQQAQPDTPKLQSLWGFRYCDLLLCNNQWEEVKARCIQTLEWLETTNSNSSLLDPALDQLSLGKAYLQQALLSGWTYKKNTAAHQESMQSAQQWLDKAVSGLRNAGTEDHLPRGLLARATLFRHQKQWQSAYADLQESFDIAQRGGMLLHLVDYHLESARLEFSQYHKKAVIQHCKAAQQLINRTAYHRRQAELNLLYPQGAKQAMEKMVTSL
jgi:tetratricopeptide (TPR) repeat protein